MTCRCGLPVNLVPRPAGPGKCSCGKTSRMPLPNPATDGTRSKTIRSDEPVPPGDTMRVRLVRGPHDAPRIEVESADPMTTADRGDTT